MLHIVYDIVYAYDIVHNIHHNVVYYVVCDIVYEMVYNVCHEIYSRSLAAAAKLLHFKVSTPLPLDSKTQACSIF
jgi:hypothetical protein